MDRELYKHKNDTAEIKPKQSKGENLDIYQRELNKVEERRYVRIKAKRKL